MENSQNIESASQNTEQNDDEISLLDLIAVLLHYKFMIIAVTGLAIIGAVVFSIISLKLPPEKSPLPNQFTPQAHMLIKEDSGSSGLSGSLSSLASLAGVSVGGGGSSRSSLANYLSTSNEYLDAVNKKFNLTERYKIEKFPVTSTRKALKKTLVSTYDDESSVFTISFTDTDPVFARDVVNFAVDWMQNRFDELGLDSIDALEIGVAIRKKFNISFSDIEENNKFEDLELPKKKNEIINFYDEPEMPKTIEELRKENADSLKEINIQNSVIDGVFTLEEYKEIKKLLDELKKVK